MPVRIRIAGTEACRAAVPTHNLIHRRKGMLRTRKLWLCAIIGVCSIAVGASLLRSQDGDQDHSGKNAGGMPDMAKMQEMMKKCEAMSKPGSNHKIFEKLAGDWK